MKNIFKAIYDNPKTTIFGGANIVIGVITIIKGGFAEGATLISTGLGLIFARDGDNGSLNPKP